VRLYVNAQTSDLLHHLAVQIKQLKHTPKEEDDAPAIHDLRVAIRRLRQCLRVFEAFFPAKQGRKVRAQLSKVMHACGDVRDRDIALGLLAEAGVDESSPLLKRLRKQRRSAQRA
jgi:CHAD domain-containing protein